MRGNIKAERSELLRHLGNKKNICFKNAQAGKIADVLVEDERDEETGLLKGYTGNYLRVMLQDSEAPGSSFVNQIIRVQITRMAGCNLSGKLC